MDLLHRGFKRLSGTKTTADPMVRTERGVELSASELGKYRKIGMEPWRVETVPVAQLFIEISLDYEPVSTAYYFNASGNPDHSIMGSPLLRLLQTYEKVGRNKLMKQLSEQDYYRFFMGVNQIGCKTNLLKPTEKVPVFYDDKIIRGKVERFLRVHESIKKEGYSLGRFAGHYIGVVETPFVVSRFGWKLEKPALEPGQYEIFSGHHRAASLACLGVPEAKVVVLKDVKL